jgi:hypothetical protein
VGGGAGLAGDRDDDAIDAIETGPTVNPPVVVGDLDPRGRSVDGFYEMEIDGSGDFDQHDVTDFQGRWVDRSDDNLIFGVDKWCHGVSGRFDVDGLSGSETFGSADQHG